MCGNMNDYPTGKIMRDSKLYEVGAARGLVVFLADSSTSGELVVGFAC